MGAVQGRTSMIVYALVDPITHLIRYVGITSCTLSVRLQYHIRKAIKSNSTTNCAKWISSLDKKKLQPQIILLQSHATWEDEVKWIARLRREGTKLLNQSNGGEGCPTKPKGGVKSLSSKAVTPLAKRQSPKP